MKALVLAALLMTQGLRAPSPAGHPHRAAEWAVRAGPVLPQSDLDGAVGVFTRAWLSEDVAGVASRMSTEGIRLQLGEEDHPVLPARQARAALEELLGSRSTRALDVSRVVDLGGAPARGFAEIRWETVVDRTSETLTHTLFVSFERDESAWRITEIRVL